MATILTVLDFHGDAHQLKACYDKALLKVAEISSARPMIHFATPRDYGLMVCDVWESEIALATFRRNREIEKVLTASGLPEPKYRTFEIHNLGWPISAMPMYR